MTNPPEQVISTVDEPATMSPTTRVVRTVLQVLAALIVSVPSAAASFNVSAATSAKFVGWMAGAVVIISAIHNAINAKAASASLNPPATNPTP